MHLICATYAEHSEVTPSFPVNNVLKTLSVGGFSRNLARTCSTKGFCVMGLEVDRTFRLHSG